MNGQPIRTSVHRGGDRRLCTAAGRGERGGVADVHRPAQGGAAGVLHGRQARPVGDQPEGHRPPQARHHDERGEDLHLLPRRARARRPLACTGQRAGDRLLVPRRLRRLRGRDDAGPGRGRVRRPRSRTSGATPRPRPRPSTRTTPRRSRPRSTGPTATPRRTSACRTACGRSSAVPGTRATASSWACWTRASPRSTRASPTTATASSDRPSGRRPRASRARATPARTRRSTATTSSSARTSSSTASAPPTSPPTRSSRRATTTATGRTRPRPRRATSASTRRSAGARSGST